MKFDEFTERFLGNQPFALLDLGVQDILVSQVVACFEWDDQTTENLAFIKSPCRKYATKMGMESFLQYEAMEFLKASVELAIPEGYFDRLEWELCQELRVQYSDEIQELRLQWQAFHGEISPSEATRRDLLIKSRQLDEKLYQNHIQMQQLYQHIAKREGFI